MNITRKEIIPGVRLTCLHTDKFKSNCLSINLLTQLDRETVSKNALIPRVLSRGTTLHPDMESLSATCDELYGARIIPAVRKKGEILSVGFYSGFIDDRFTPDKSKLLEKVCALLCEMLLLPNTHGGLLRKDYVESERQKLIDDIKALLNDKRGYASHRLIEEMCVFEPYACDDMGSVQDAEAVNYIDLTHHYRQLLQKCPIEIFYCGSAEDIRVISALSDALVTLPRGETDYELGTDIRMNAVEASPRRHTEHLNVTQGKLGMGFRLGECMEEPNIAALRVFNCLYGGGVTSKLFMNVREKLSLCYYASSAVDILKGIMIVSSGIEFDKAELVQAEIMKNLKDMKDGNFTGDELQAAKSAVSSDLISKTDSPGALEEFYLLQTLLGLDYGPVELAALCEVVSAEDILEVAKGIELDMIYFLCGSTDESEEDEDDA